MTPHLFLVHFPVSLLVAGALLDLAGAILTARDLRVWGGRLLIAGALLAFLAFVTGEGAELSAASSGELDFARLEAHQQWGSVGVWGLLIAALLRGLWRYRLEGGHGWINLALAILAATLIIAITLSGTLVRHGA